MSQSDRRRRTYAWVAIFLAIVMLVTMVQPGTQNTTPVEIPPTPTPPPATFPPPPQNLEQIGFDTVYLHPSGLFTVAQPDNWTPIRPTNNGTQVQIQMENQPAQSIIEAYIEVPVTPIETLQQLSDRFNQSAIEAGWRNYATAQETGRRIDEATGQVIIDFELGLNRQTYLARHVASLDENGWIHVVRVVTPQNARDLLLYLIDNMPQTIDVVDLFVGTPIVWTSRYDPVNQHIIRYPNTWLVVSGGGQGEVTNIEGANGEFLDVFAVEGGAVADEAAASAYVESTRAGITIKSVVPVTRRDASGFAVAYGYNTLDGEPVSGLAVLLNDEAGNLHVVNVRVPRVNVDYNNLPEGTPAPDAVNIAATFYLTEGLGFPAPAPVAPSPEITQQVAPPVTTEEPTEEAAVTTPEPTEEPTEEPTAEAAVTVEPTEEPTEEPTAEVEN